LSDLHDRSYDYPVVRELLKRMSRGVVLQRRLPKVFGDAPILVSPDSALAYWRRDLGSVDPYLLSMARELVRPGMMVWDIGANVGLFAFAAAALGARVLAVEPDIWLSNLLHRSRLLNGLPVTVLPAAVGETLGIGKLYLSQQGRASNSMCGSGAYQTTVTVTMDWLVGHFQPPSIVKIDIEGMEASALRGASHLLQLKPTILCEVTREHEAVGSILRVAGYKMYGARSSERSPLQMPYCETLAIADR
jgi:FkbM family methyltransferase